MLQAGAGNSIGGAAGGSDGGSSGGADHLGLNK